MNLERLEISTCLRRAELEVTIRYEPDAEQIAQQLVDAGRARTGLLYLAGTLVAALAAVYAGIAVTRLLARTRRGRA